jgi:hypothetical protein
MLEEESWDRERESMFIADWERALVKVVGLGGSVGGTGGGRIATGGGL